MEWNVALPIYIFKGKEQERRKKKEGGGGGGVSAHKPNIIVEFNKKEITRRLVS